MNRLTDWLMWHDVFQSSALMQLLKAARWYENTHFCWLQKSLGPTWICLSHFRSTCYRCFCYTVHAFWPFHTHYLFSSIIHSPIMCRQDWKAFLLFEYQECRLNLHSNVILSVYKKSWEYSQLISSWRGVKSVQQL